MGSGDGTETSTTVRRRIEAPAHLVWALVADTNRFDRAAGLTPGRYSFALRDAADPRSRVRIAEARELGFDLRWIEPPYEWAEARFVYGERRFLSGPMMRGGFRVDLVPDGVDGAATNVEARAWVAGEGVLSWVARRVMKGKFTRALTSYLASIDAVLARTHAALGYDWQSEPPAAAARRALMVERTDPVTSGASSPLQEADFAHRSRRFDSAPIDPALRERILAFVRERPDEELAQIRPFEVARAWGVDRRDVLAGFLHAARAGLVELQWQLNCPTCRVGAEVVPSLAEVVGTAHCDACNIRYDLDFGEHVEATFRVSPAIRRVESAVYCVSSPWFRPHVLAQVTVPAGASRSFSAPLPDGKLLVRTLAGKRRAEIELAHPPASLRVTVDGGAVHATAHGASTSGSGPGSGSGDVAIELVSTSDSEETILFERAGWSAEVVLGSAIASLPEFVDLFATEAPAAGVELTVGALTLLFSDLTGSTALYERIGDARAYALVEEHFRQMAQAIARHEGAIVKTMGDAVMATFTSPAQALLAAIDMIESCESSHAGEGVHVKVGLHEGPCLAVRANDRLDYFGTTVNVAARLQAQAGSSELVLVKDLLAHAEIARIVAERGFPRREFTASLKGIAAAQTLVALGIGAVARPEARRAPG